MARIAYCSAMRCRAKQDRGLVHGAIRKQVLWHVRGLADKWIPLFMQPRIAFGLDLAKHFVSSASLSRDGLHPALRVKQVLMHFAELEAQKPHWLQSKHSHPLLSFPEGRMVSSRQPQDTSCRPGRLAAAAGSHRAEQERGRARRGVRLQERGKKCSSAVWWKWTLPLWARSCKNAERVENSAFCIRMGAATAPSAAWSPFC